MGLVELHLKVSRHAEVRHQPIPLVRYVVGELDAPLLELGNGSADVVAVERDVGGAGRRTFCPFSGMAAQVRLGKVEDQPAFADVGEGETQLVANEGAKLLGLRGVEHGV